MELFPTALKAARLFGKALTISSDSRFYSSLLNTKRIGIVRKYKASSLFIPDIKNCNDHYLMSLLKSLDNRRVSLGTRF